MSKRTAPERTEVGYRLSRRRFLVTSGALVAAAACTTTPARAPSGGVTEGTVKLSAWTIGPDAPSYYRRDNLISAAMKLKGKTYGVPQDTEARPMYYRKDLLAKMGWSKDKIDGLPEAVMKGEWAWPDFVATAKDAIAKGVVGPGKGWYSRPSKGADIYMFYYQNGGEMQDTATAKLVIVKDALQKHFQVHADAVRNDKIMTQPNYGMEAGKEWHPTVTDGKVLFYNAGSWTWKDWQATYKVPEQSLWDNVGFMLIPAAKRRGKPVTVSHPLAYAVTSNAKDKDLAFRLIANATTPDLNSKHSVTSAHLAVLTTQKDDPTYKQDKFLLATQYMLDYTKFIPKDRKSVVE